MEKLILWLIFIYFLFFAFKYIQILKIKIHIYIINKLIIINTKYLSKEEIINKWFFNLLISVIISLFRLLKILNISKLLILYK